MLKNNEHMLLESNTHLLKTKKSTTYFPQITIQNTEKYLSKRRKLESTCLLACLPAQHVSTNNICLVYWKLFCIFGQSSPTIYLMWYRLTLLFPEFTSIIPFMVWFQDSIQIKGRGTFLYLASSVNIRLNFFNWKLKTLIFLI